MPIIWVSLFKSVTVQVFVQVFYLSKDKTVIAKAADQNHQKNIFIFYRKLSEKWHMLANQGKSIKSFLADYTVINKILNLKNISNLPKTIEKFDFFFPKILVF